MFQKLKSLFGRAELTEDNAFKQINDCLNMIFDGDYFAERYAGVAIFKKRDDLRTAFIGSIRSDLKRIITGDKPFYEFREKIINNIKVSVTNSVLLEDEFKFARERICEVINRGIRETEGNEVFKRGMVLVKDAEMFSDQPWGDTKLVHESAWAEVEGMVLRHLQITVFEHVSKDTDWSSIYREAYRKYMTDLYRLMIAKADAREGFPHPMLAAMGCESLTRMEETILEGSQK